MFQGVNAPGKEEEHEFATGRAENPEGKSFGIAAEQPLERSSSTSCLQGNAQPPPGAGSGMAVLTKMDSAPLAGGRASGIVRDGLPAKSGDEASFGIAADKPLDSSGETGLGLSSKKVPSCPGNPHKPASPSRLETLHEPTLPESPKPKQKSRSAGLHYNSKDILVASLPLPQDIMGASGKQPSAGHLSAAETAAMVHTFKSGIRHAGWLHKLVGKTPQDTNWRKYWCFLQDDRLYYQSDPEQPASRTRYIAIDRVPVRPLPHRRRWADATMMTSPDIGASLVDTRVMAHLGVKLEPNTVFGLVSGSHSIFFAASSSDEARAWIRAIHEAWVHCFKHTLRGTDTKDQTLQETSRLLAANEALRKSLVEAKDTSAVEQNETETWKQWLEEKARNKMLEKQLNGNAMYEVEVKTGGIKGASTDARVSLEMMGPGDDATTSELRLATPESHHPCFTRNALDVFLVTAKDVGLPRVIKIWHDNTGRHPDWFVDHIRIRKRQGTAPPGPSMIQCSPRSPFYTGKRTRPPSAPAAAGVHKVNANGRGGGRGGIGGGAVGVRHSLTMSDLHRPPRPRSVVRTSLDVGRLGGRGAGGPGAANGRGSMRNSVELGGVMLRRSRDLEGGLGGKDRGKHAGADVGAGVPIGDKAGSGTANPMRPSTAAGLHGGPAGDMVAAGGDIYDGDHMLDGVWGPWVVFPCLRWLSTEVDDCRIRRTLFVGHQSPVHTYKVLTHTSDIRGASSDANVHLIMHGTLGDSKRHVLTSGPDDFSRGVTNTFEIDDEELGELLEITIGHDGTSSSPSWHLDHVVVFNCKTDQKFVFPCRQWFDARMGDGLLERTLPASLDAGSMVPYTLKITTADQRGASTDADVFVSLHGKKGSTPVTVLPSQPENFERGITDTFRLFLPDVGEVQSMTIGHNNQGHGPDWCMEMAEVSTDTVEAKGSTYWFFCNKWFGLGPEAGGMLERTLVATTEDPRKYMAEYRVEFHTSAERGAGTDASVSFQLFGDKGQSEMQRVVASKEAFERGTVDTFTYKGMRYMGKLSRMVIQHDNTGASPDWHLFKAVVFCSKDNSTTTFMCNKWIQSKSPSAVASVELTPGDTEPEITSYHIDVYTSTCKGAGTDSNVSIRIQGSEGALGPYKLDTPNAFSRGSKDTFVLKQVPDLGLLQSIDVALDGPGTLPMWHLNRITISKGGPPDIDGENVVFFPCGAWFGKQSSLTKTLKAAKMSPEEGEVPYLVRILTADRKGAGTDSSVSARIVGSKGDSGWQPLLANHDMFERGQEDVFKLSLPDVGVIRSLSLRTDGLSEKPSWCFEWAVVELDELSWKGQKQDQPKTATASPAFFVAGDSGWIGPSPLPTEVTLTPVAKDPRGDKVTFTVWVHTSDVKYAGTDADIIMEIVGDVCTSSRKPLVDPMGQRDLFERGQVDEFRVHCCDIGRVRSIIIESNGMGSKPNWHLDMVVIEDSSKQKYFFPFTNWLGPATQLKAEIPGQLQDPAAGRRAYEVIVHTSNCQNASTDANVYVDIRGIMGSTGKVALRNDSIDCFERGQVDKFRVPAPMDLGPLVELVVGHDQAGGLMDAWHLEQVDIVDPSGKTLYFDCDRWLDSKNGLEAVLQPSETNPRGELRTYTVTTRTGAGGASATDAKVYVDMKGSLGSSGRQWLRNASAFPFQSGQADVFQLTCKNLGPLTELLIGHDNSGISPNWFLESVSVVDDAVQTTYWFLCDQWLDSNHGDRLIERVLRASTKPVEAKRIVPYQIAVKTSDVSGASTNANVSMTMYGTKGKDTGPLRLESGGKACFQQGQEDVFELSALEVDPIRKVRIGHDNTGGVNAPWHVAYVEVLNKTSGARTRFNAHCWFSATHEDFQLERDLFPAGSQTEENMYSIEVFTSNIKGAGTDCDVYCKLYGQQGATGDLRLDNPKDNMEAGQRDSFLIRAEDVGLLHRVKVWHDGTGPKPSWHMDYMTIVASARPDVKYWCFCGQWVDKAHGLVKELKALTYDPRNTLTAYTIIVHTADVPHAGTDANVSINLIGADGESGPRELKGAGNLFERGQADTFKLSMLDLGDLEKLDVWHDNSGAGAAWNLAYVEVQTSNGKVWYFPCFLWFDAKQGDGLTRRMLKATQENPAKIMAKYRVTVITADEFGAGTDARVYINIFGEKGETGHVTLDNPNKNDFERGQTDVFKFESTNVSPMTKIIIGHDGKGLGAGWKLANVIVENTTAGESLTFEANRWLDKAKEDGALEVELLPSSNIVGGINWKLTIVTGDIPGAGTDADVIVEVEGEVGGYGPHQLHAMKSAFERGCHDVFALTTPDLGMIRSMTLGHNNKGMGASWYLERAVLENVATGEQFVFQFQCWLDASNGLKAKRPVLIYRKATKGNLSDYRVELTTGPEEESCLSSGNVMVDMHGSEGETGRQNLGMPPQGFMPSRVEAYLLPKLPNTGSVSELEIGHTGPTPWSVREVRVTNVNTGASATFLVDKLLQPSEFVKLKPRVLPPCDYELKVATSNRPGAGTSANVYFDLAGYKGATGRVPLPEVSDAAGGGNSDGQSATRGSLPTLCSSTDECRPRGVGNGLARGGKGVYVIKNLPDVGIMKSLTIGHDNSGPRPGWHLAHVRVRNLRTGVSALFPCDQWLAKDEADNQIERTLDATDVSTDKQGKPPSAAVTEPRQWQQQQPAHQQPWSLHAQQQAQQQQLAQQLAAQQQQQLAQQQQLLQPIMPVQPLELKAGTTGPPGYKVTFNTSSVCLSGTNAPVFFELVGLNGSSGTVLVRSLEGQFTRGSSDAFVYPRLPFLGPLLQMRVGTTGEGMASTWHLSNVVVNALGTGETWMFECNDWIDKKTKWQKVLNARKQS